MRRQEKELIINKETGQVELNLDLDVIKGISQESTIKANVLESGGKDDKDIDFRDLSEEEKEILKNKDPDKYYELAIKEEARKFYGDEAAGTSKDDLSREDNDGYEFNWQKRHNE